MRGASRPVVPAVLAGVIVLQVLQGIGRRARLDPFLRSYWYVSYQFGFVRRGLTGEGLRLLLGHSPTEAATNVSADVLVALTLMVVVGLVVLLWREGNVLGYGLAVLLATSPFVFDFLAYQRRPDVVGFLLLGILGIAAATTGADAFVLGLVGGLLLAPAALITETAPLQVGPWLVLVVVACARAQGKSRSGCCATALAASVPWVGTLAVLAFAGHRSDSLVNQLVSSAPRTLGPKSGNEFQYLGDNIGQSLDRVRSMGLNRQLATLALGALLIALTVFVARPIARHMGPTFRWIIASRGSRWCWLSVWLLSLVLLFALGVDWMRWIAAESCAALITGASVGLLLSRHQLPDQPPAPLRVPFRISDFSMPWLFAACGLGVYLTMLQPLADVSAAHYAARFLLGLS